MAKKLPIIISLFLSSVLLSFSQDKSFTIKSGIGYYTDMLGWYDGPILFIEGGYGLRTGFVLNARVSIATIDWQISEGFFKDYKTIALRQMGDIVFSRPIKLAARQYFEPGFGFKIKREYNLYPDLSIDHINGQTYLSPSYSKIFYEIGFTVCLDFYHRFKSGFFVGLRTDTNIIWALGFEGLTVSPLFGFRF